MRFFLLLLVALVVLELGCVRAKHEGGSEGVTLDRPIAYQPDEPDQDEPENDGLGWIDFGTPPSDPPPPAVETCAGSCVAASPEGWTPALVWVGAGEPPPCPGGAAPSWEGGAGVLGEPAACSSCSCSSSGQPGGFGPGDVFAAADLACGSCSAESPDACGGVSLYSGQIYQGIPVVSEAGIDVAKGFEPVDPASIVGTCIQRRDASAAYAPIVVSASGGVDVFVRPVALVAASCKATAGGGVASVEPAAFEARARACSPVAQAGACADGLSCVSTEAGGAWRSCVSTEAGGACPESFPDELVLASSIVDDRACSPCSCSREGATITRHYAIWSGSCNGPAALVFDDTRGPGDDSWRCLASGLSSVSGIMVGDTSTNWGTCGASGGEPIGAAVASGERRFCCAGGAP